MAQITTSIRPRFFQVNRWIFTLVFMCGLAVSALSQQQPYLLLQGPSEGKTYRFTKGQEIEWRLNGEEEFFSARIIDLFPESQTIRIDDIILSISNIAAVRHRKRGAGLREYLQGQGIANLAILGGFTAFSKRARNEQKSFMIVAAVVSTAMVVIGSIGKQAVRDVNSDGRYILKVAGGDLREGDGD